MTDPSPIDRFKELIPGGVKCMAQRAHQGVIHSSMASRLQHFSDLTDGLPCEAHNCERGRVGPPACSHRHLYPRSEGALLVMLQEFLENHRV